MSEKDPYADKKKNLETGMNKNPDLESESTRKPEDDINPVRPQTSIPDTKNREPDQTSDDSQF